MLPGFSQTAEQFEKQIGQLSQEHRIIAVDHRGHGQSGKPTHGYRISRLAADLRDLMESLDLHDVALLGHSMGCTVAWAYWDLFGGDRISGMILVDQGPVIAADLVLPDQAVELGAIFTSDMAYGIAAGLRGEGAVQTSTSIVDMMHTPDMSTEDVAWIVGQNLLLPREHAAAVHLDHYGNDWRDVLPRITVPTLVIGGESSIFSPQVSQWVASRIPDAHLRIFSAAESGSHLMFWENPELFNTVVTDFLSRKSVS
jgi:non-heme chloroperoxidase